MMCRFSIRVLLVIAVLSVVLGVLNNFRVYEEQQVSWFGEESGKTGE